MVAVGVWGAQLGMPAIWILPVTFPMVMAFGGMLALLGVAIPGVEIGIAASALLLGTMVLLEAKPPLAAAAALVGVFAIFHGHAHGTELPEGASGLLYSIGFVVATGCLHGARHRDRDGPSVRERASGPARRRGAGRRRRPLLPVSGTVLSNRRSTTIVAAATAAALACPASAHAHLVQSGLGPFYDGIAHFALSPDDWLCALAIALLGGLAGARGGRTVLFLLPLAWAIGGVLGLERDTVADWPAASAMTLVVAGALVAWNPKLPAAHPDYASASRSAAFTVISTGRWRRPVASGSPACSEWRRPYSSWRRWRRPWSCHCGTRAPVSRSGLPGVGSPRSGC